MTPEKILDLGVKISLKDQIQNAVIHMLPIIGAFFAPYESVKGVNKNKNKTDVTPKVNTFAN